jgi:hypothetical protein
MSTVTIPPALLAKLGSTWSAALLGSAVDGPIPVADVLAAGAAIGLSGKALYDYYQNNKIVSRDADFDPNKTPTAPKTVSTPRHTGHGKNTAVKAAQNTELPTDSGGVNAPRHTGNTEKLNLEKPFFEHVDGPGWSTRHSEEVGILPNIKTTKHKLKTGPIVLDDGNEAGGRIHARKHEKDKAFKDAGFSDIDELVKTVASNPHTVYKGSGTDTYVLTRIHNKLVANVVITPSKAGYKVVTGYVSEKGVMGPSTEKIKKLGNNQPAPQSQKKAS